MKKGGILYNGGKKDILITIRNETGRAELVYHEGSIGQAGQKLSASSTGV